MTINSFGINILHRDLDFLECYIRNSISLMGGPVSPYVNSCNFEFLNSKFWEFCKVVNKIQDLGLKTGNLLIPVLKKDGIIQLISSFLLNKKGNYKLLQEQFSFLFDKTGELSNKLGKELKRKGINYE